MPGESTCRSLRRTFPLSFTIQNQNNTNKLRIILKLTKKNLVCKSLLIKITFFDTFVFQFFFSLPRFVICNSERDVREGVFGDEYLRRLSEGLNKIPLVTQEICYV